MVNQVNIPSYGAYSAPEAELICLAQETSFLDSNISDLPGNTIVNEEDEP